MKPLMYNPFVLDSFFVILTIWLFKKYVVFTQVHVGLCECAKKCYKIVMKLTEIDLVSGLRSIAVLNSLHSSKMMILC